LFYLLQPLESIAQVPGPLVVFALTCLEHRLTHLCSYVQRATGEELQDLIDHRTILRLFLPSHAWGQATPDIEVQAGAITPINREVVTAGTDGVEATDDRQ
jgi:hypothetical protein